MTASDLTGRTVLVTGASKGIGAVIVRTLGAGGADVIAHYGSDRAGAEAACAALPAERRLLVQADLAEPGGARAVWRQAVEWHGRVDVVVANAAINLETPWDAADDEWDAAWDATLRVNVRATADLVREAVQHFVGAGGGVLVTLSSWAALRGSALPQLSAYAASKAAVRALTQTVAQNHASDGVLAYVVAPGLVNAGMSAPAIEQRGGVDAVNATLPMGEMVPPEEVADLVAYLASGRCRHLTGATLDLNGASYVR